ncbi:MAG: hypothetical protein ACM3Q2_00715, partial [Syntrophothermus sp.]
MRSHNLINFITGIAIGKKSRIILLLYLGLLICLTDMYGKTFVNKEASFSITLPADWIQIPKDSIKNVNDIKKAEYEHFDYLYKPQNAEKLSNYPHILLQVIRPGSFSDRRELGSLADWKLENITQKYLLGMDNKFYLEKSTGR